MFDEDQGFMPYEVPTCGIKPPLSLIYDDYPDGCRIVLNNSPWVLLVTRADGKREPLDRIGGKLLEPGDAVSLPESACEPVEPRAVFRARIDGVAEYQLANAPRFDDDEESRERFDRERFTHWWWYRRETADGLVLHLHPASTNARLSVSILGDMGFQGSWCYPRHDDGWRAAMGWNGWGDPPDGWVRHLETARRRKDGTPATEYVQAAEGGAPWVTGRGAP